MTHSLDEKDVLAIAQYAGLAPELVRAVHAREWRKLERQARIKAFLPLLVLKRVRECCARPPERKP